MVSRLVLVAASLLPFCFTSTNSLCMLCEDGVVGIKWHFHKVDSSGTTCVQQAIRMAMTDAGTWECQQEIADFREMCCGDAKPEEVPQVPTKLPTYNGPTGNNQPCDICHDGDYPGNTAMVINMLYIGVGSCKQYYDYGRAGLIPDHLCDPLQFFAEEPCGCVEFNTAEDAFPPKVPTASSSSSAQEPIKKIQAPEASGVTDSNSNTSPAKPPAPKPTTTSSSSAQEQFKKVQAETSDSSTDSSSNTVPSKPPAPKPTPRPTQSPTMRPTNRPTLKPTKVPTQRPTVRPIRPGAQPNSSSSSSKSKKMSGKKDKKRNRRA